MNPEMPIPNDDPECPCHPGKSPNPKSDGLALCYSTSWENQEHHWLTIYPSCPHHGNIVPSLTRTLHGNYSITEP